MNTSADIQWEELTLKLRNPFRLSYGTSETRQVFWLRLPGDSGWGEAAVPPYFGIDPSAILYHWEKVRKNGHPLPDDPLDVPEWVRQAEGPRAAYTALEMALFDRIARQQDVPLYRLFELPEPEPLPTSFTIAIDMPDAMARMAEEISNYPVIKIKLGSDELDMERVAAIRSARPNAKLRIDANAGWSLNEAIAAVERLEEYDVEMIEQPLGKDEFAGMGEVQKHTRIPVIGDESVHQLTDLEHLADAGAKGINLKLMKVGGLFRAVEMLRRAQELDMKVMLGCMIETSLGATAMAHLSGLADWLDLDSPLLISNDPFEGITYGDEAEVQIPDRPGIGAVLRQENGV